MPGAKHGAPNCVPSRPSPVGSRRAPQEDGMGRVSSGIGVQMRSSSATGVQVRERSSRVGCPEVGAASRFAPLAKYSTEDDCDALRV
ncbi:hypothetical protein Dimus_024495, partial [Dionaea muscipula]